MVNVSLFENGKVQRVVVLGASGSAISVKGNEKSVLVIAQKVVIDIAPYDMRSSDLLKQQAKQKGEKEAES
jgi:hypothetical protein